MKYLDQLNARVKKSAQVIARVSPLEGIAKSIQADVVASNSYLVQKDWAKWNEEKKGGFVNSGHQKMIDHHESKASEHQDKYTEVEGAAGDAHKKAADLHEFAASKHREALTKLQVHPAGLKDHQKVYDAAKGKADAASEKANQASVITKGEGKGQHGHQVGRPKGDGNHASHSEAMAAAHEHIKSQGYHISDENWQQHIAGTPKPAEGKTNRYDIPMHKDGQETNKYAHIQVYNRGNNIPHNYELNTYLDSGKPKLVQKNAQEVVQKDWTHWNEEHKHGGATYKKLLPGAAGHLAKQSQRLSHVIDDIKSMNLDKDSPYHREAMTEFLMKLDELHKLVKVK